MCLELLIFVCIEGGFGVGGLVWGGGIGEGILMFVLIWFRGWGFLVGDIFRLSGFYGFFLCLDYDMKFLL